jgi:fused signal recognition particle receptor
MALGFLGRLKEGLSRSTQKLTGGISAVFVRRKLDDAALEELEELLLGADLGPQAASSIVANFRRSRFGRDVTDSEVKEALAEEIAAILEPVAIPLVLDPARRPHVVLVVGVNGTGKTTTIGKLALQYREQGLRPVLVAGDTFRAAAVEQLQIWAQRTGAAFVGQKTGADPGAVIFDAVKNAAAQGVQVVIADTAGRLHSQSHLMDELKKVKRVIQRVAADAPHEVLLVLDANQGQNALAQAEQFHAAMGVTGLVVTKLDGTAKGGILVAIARRMKLPIRFVGVGESAEDFGAFDAAAFATALVGEGP